jgi:hypothetical protein
MHDTTPKFNITAGLTPIKIHFNYENAYGTPINLSGYTANFQVRSPSNKILLDLTDDELFVGYDKTGFNFETDTPTLKNGEIKLNADKDGNSGFIGGVYISISSDAIEQIRDGRNTYTLQITSGGNTTQLLTGSFIKRRTAKNRRSIEKLKINDNFINDIKIRPSETRSDLDDPVNNDVTFRFASDLATTNTFARLPFCEYPIPNPTRTMYIAPTGSDITGTGSRTNPFKTVKKAVNSLPNDLLPSYVVFLNGIYNINTIGAGNHAYTRLSGSRETCLMSTIGLNDTTDNTRKITLMAEKPLKSILLGSIYPSYLGVTGASSDIRTYDLSGPTFSVVNGNQTEIRKYFNIFNVTDVGVVLGPTSGEATLNTTLKTPHPVILYGGITQNKDDWISQANLWTIPFVNTATTYGISYTSETNPSGGTLWYIGDITGGTRISNIINSLGGSGFSWSDTAIAIRGGNNGNHLTTIKGLSSGVKFIVNSHPGSSIRNSTNALAIMGNPGFTQDDNSIAYKNQTLYYRGQTYQNLRLNAIDMAFILNNTTDLTICGFEIGEFRSGIRSLSLGGSTYGTASTSRKSLEIKYNFIRDCLHPDTGYGIDAGNHFRTRIFGNFVANTYYRGIACSSPQPLVVSATSGSGLTGLLPGFTFDKPQPYYPGSYNLEISFNTVYAWKSYSGIYLQDAKNIKIFNNNIYANGPQHGNGIALYGGNGNNGIYHRGCFNVELNNNFVWVPGGNALTQQRSNIYSNPWVVRNNAFKSSGDLYDPWILHGIVWENNVGIPNFYPTYPGGVSYARGITTNNQVNTWWGLYNKIFRNNIGIPSSTNIGYSPVSGSTLSGVVDIASYFEDVLSLGNTAMPLGFTGEKSLLRYGATGPSGNFKVKFNSYSWIQSDAGQTLPNLWNNLFPWRPVYDMYPQAGNAGLPGESIVFPYAETRSLLFTPRSVYPGNNEELQNSIRNEIFRDYNGNDLRIKPGITGSTLGIGVNWKGPTSNFDNIATWWLFGVTNPCYIQASSFDISAPIADGICGADLTEFDTDGPIGTGPNIQEDAFDYRRNSDLNNSKGIDIANLPLYIYKETEGGEIIDPELPNQEA